MLYLVDFKVKKASDWLICFRRNEQGVMNVMLGCRVTFHSAKGKLTNLVRVVPYICGVSSGGDCFQWVYIKKYQRLRNHYEIHQII